MLHNKFCGNRSTGSGTEGFLQYMGLATILGHMIPDAMNEPSFSLPIYSHHKMRLVLRKSFFCICKNKDAVTANLEASL